MHGFTIIFKNCRHTQTNRKRALAHEGGAKMEKKTQRKGRQGMVGERRGRMDRRTSHQQIYNDKRTPRLRDKDINKRNPYFFDMSEKKTNPILGIEDCQKTRGGGREG